jgi:hypothetical protein
LDAGSATITRIEEQLGITNRTCTEYFPNFERDVLERHLDWLAPDHYSPQHDRFVLRRAMARRVRGHLRESEL